MLINEFREYLANLFPDEHLDMQPVRSKRNVINYISKEGVELFTNIKENLLSFHYQIYKCRTRVFKVTDPFVVEHRYNYKFLEKYLSQHKYNELRNFYGLRQYFGNF